MTTNRLATQRGQAGARPSRGGPRSGAPSCGATQAVWLPEAVRTLHDELPNLQVPIASQYSPDPADALTRGKLDVALCGRKRRHPSWCSRW